MEELRTLGSLLSRLGTEANAIQKNTTTGLSELDATLKAVGEAWDATASASSTGPASGQQAVDGHTLDLLRLSSDFAQDLATLARQTMLLARDMRAHVAPFRLDPAQGGEIDLPLYTPGTGYGSQQAPSSSEPISWYQG